MSQNFITLITQQETPFGMHSNQDDNSNILNEPFAHIPLPAGIRCYSDASWKDNISGFGIFIHNHQNHMGVFVQGFSHKFTSPFQAELAGIIFWASMFVQDFRCRTLS